MFQPLRIIVWLSASFATVLGASLPVSATSLYSNALHYRLVCGNFTKYVDGYNSGGPDNYHVGWKVVLANHCNAELTLYCLAYNLLPDVAGYEATETQAASRAVALLDKRLNGTSVTLTVTNTNDFSIASSQ